MAAAALVERPPGHSGLPAGPSSGRAGNIPVKKPPGKAPLPGRAAPLDKAAVPGKPAPPAKPGPPPPVVTTQPAAVTLPPPVPGQPKKAEVPVPKRDGPEEVHLTARPSYPDEKLPEFGDVPVVLRCPQCFFLVKTRIELENGRFAKTTACVACCTVVCCCCFWVPLYSDYFKDLYHVCPMCNGILFEKKRMG